MTTELPRIAAARTQGDSTVRIRWKGRNAFDAVDLIGWIATGGDALKPLCDQETFRDVRVIHYGAAIGWGGEDGPAIDAVHLAMLAEEQKPFTGEDAQQWQARIRISNNEAADMLGVSLSTWNSYKAGSSIPSHIAMVLRCAERDPLLMQAHFRPRIAGRPRKGALLSEVVGVQVAETKVMKRSGVTRVVAKGKAGLKQSGIYEVKGKASGRIARPNKSGGKAS